MRNAYCSSVPFQEEYLSIIMTNVPNKYSIKFNDCQVLLLLGKKSPWNFKSFPFSTATHPADLIEQTDKNFGEI